MMNSGGNMIGFRVDANEIVATGHLMRCITIAMECRKRGEECIFLLAEDKETDKLKERDIPYCILHSKWNHLDQEKELLRQMVEKKQIDWLIVDTYQISDNYLEYLEKYVKVLYIDDMGEKVYPVSAVLHYSQWQDDFSYQEKYSLTHTVLLSGMKYVPIREEFKKNADCLREKSVLITTGGTDPYNIAGKLLRELIKNKCFQEFSFQVVIGSMNQNMQMLQELAQQESRICLHHNINNIDEYMRKCTCAVSAGGTTLFELCASGLPTVCFSFADNQIKFSKELSERKIMMYAGDARENSALSHIICDNLEQLVKNQILCQTYSEHMQELVDGNGASRIAEFLSEQTTKEQQCTLRKAQIEDAGILYQWKNDKLCIQNSLSGYEVKWEEHILWLRRTLKNSKSKLYIMEWGGAAVGQLRLDEDNEGAMISYSIANEFRGQHLGKKLLQLAEKEACLLNIKMLKAVVLKHNIRSQKLFSQLGYTEKTVENMLYYEKNIEKE